MIRGGNRDIQDFFCVVSNREKLLRILWDLRFPRSAVEIGNLYKFIVAGGLGEGE